MGLVNGIHHVSMKCTKEELDRVTDFYYRILGLEIVRRWADGVMFTAGNELIEIFSTATEKNGMGVIRHFAFATDDVDACVEAVRNAGYEVITGPKDIVIPSEPELAARMAFCFGPLGEEIEFFCER